MGLESLRQKLYQALGCSAGYEETRRGKRRSMISDGEASVDGTHSDVPALHDGSAARNDGRDYRPTTEGDSFIGIERASRKEDDAHDELEDDGEDPFAPDRSRIAPPMHPTAPLRSQAGQGEPAGGEPKRLSSEGASAGRTSLSLWPQEQARARESTNEHAGAQLGALDRTLDGLHDGTSSDLPLTKDPAVIHYMSQPPAQAAGASLRSDLEIQPSGSHSNDSQTPREHTRPSAPGPPAPSGSPERTPSGTSGIAPGGEHTDTTVETSYSARKRHSDQTNKSRHTHQERHQRARDCPAGRRAPLPCNRRPHRLPAHSGAGRESRRNPYRSLAGLQAWRSTSGYGQEAAILSLVYACIIQRAVS